MLAFICIFCSMLASGLYAYAEEPGGFPGVLELVAQYLASASTALWIQADALRRQRRLPYDFDSLVFFYWLIAAPIYLFRTRGWRALGPIGLFVLLQVVAILFAGLLEFPRSFER